MRFLLSLFFFLLIFVSVSSSSYFEIEGGESRKVLLQRFRGVIGLSYTVLCSDFKLKKLSSRFVQICRNDEFRD